MSFFRPYVLSMYNTSNSIDVLSFDEVKFDVKSDLLERIKKTSNKIRSNVFSVIDVFYVFSQILLSMIVYSDGLKYFVDAAGKNCHQN